jgi:hypothetical protein
MKNDIYGEPEVIKSGNIIAKVYSPTITEQEKERRIAAMRKASVSMVLSKGAHK